MPNLRNFLSVNTQINIKPPVKDINNQNQSETNREGLDVPLHCALFRHPLGTASAALEPGGVGVTGHRHQDGHVVGGGAALKLTPRLRKTRAANKSTRSFRRTEEVVRMRSSANTH